jgi:hypothetical protein
MNVSDNSQDQHEGQKLNRPINADAEDQLVYQEQATGKITSLNPRQREQNTQPFTSSDEMIDQIERMEKLLRNALKMNIIYEQKIFRKYRLRVLGHTLSIHWWR